VRSTEERAPMSAWVRRLTTYDCAAATGSLVHETVPGSGRSGGRQRKEQGGVVMSKSQSRRWRLGGIGGSRSG
jgi:hypothetical protein